MDGCKYDISCARVHYCAEPFATLVGVAANLRLSVGPAGEAVALYGPHASGTDLDSNERAMLDRVCDRAADRYAQLENEGLRRRAATLERELSARIPRPEAGAA
jgi:hypothetical protein